MSRLALCAAATAVLLATLPSAVVAQTGYAAVWRPGSGGQWWRAGMTGDQMKAQDATHFGNGFRLTTLTRRDNRYTALWHPGSGAQRWRGDKTVADIESHDATYFKEGLRLASLKRNAGHLNAVWRPGNGAQWWRTDMAEADFNATDKKHFDNGLRITSFDVDDGRFTAVWRPGTGAQWVHANMTGGQFEAQDKTYVNQGLRLTAMAVDGTRYAGVWRTGTGTQWTSRRRCAVDLATEDTDFFGRGLRMSFIEAQGDPLGSFRYPWAGGTEMDVGQGNNTTNSHNGSQAFAFDFSLPSMTPIFAAKGGTVEWLRNNQTTNFDPTEPEGPGNVAYAAGSVQNWGNAVRIRHRGGLTSWYFHIKHEGVLVAEGDTVTTGQIIAMSGNSGRTSGPHLHFQVQADSNDWGQSVPITFANCAQPVRGDTVTSNN